MPERLKSRTTTEDKIMASNPIHPGEHLAEILDELEISGSRLARAIGVPPRRINDILRGVDPLRRAQRSASAKP